MKVTTGCKNKNNEGKERQHRSKVQKKEINYGLEPRFLNIFLVHFHTINFIFQIIYLYTSTKMIFISFFLKSKEKEILKFSDDMLIKCSKKYIHFNLLFTIFYNTKFLCIFLLRQIHNSLCEYR